MTNYSYEGNEIIIFEKHVEFPNKIEQVIENDGYIFVRIAVKRDEINNSNNEVSNVYALNEKGNIIWKIKNVPPKDNPQFITNSLVDISTDDGKLFTRDFSGAQYKVSLEDGSMKMIGVSRF